MIKIPKNKIQYQYGDAGNMTQHEKHISFQNRYFIFKKISNVNIDRVISEEINNEQNEIPLENDLEISKEETEHLPTPTNYSRPPSPDYPPPTINPASGVKKRKIQVSKPKKLNKSIVLDGSK